VGASVALPFCVSEPPPHPLSAVKNAMPMSVREFVKAETLKVGVNKTHQG
jgi:hypothetical protein